MNLEKHVRKVEFQAMEFNKIYVRQMVLQKIKHKKWNKKIELQEKYKEACSQNSEKLNQVN